MAEPTLGELMVGATQFSVGYKRLRTRLVEAIDSSLASAQARGLTPEDVGDAEDLAGTVGAAIPTIHPTAELVGPCYDTSGLVRWLGISKQALDKRNRAGTVLACRTADGHWVYPAWQFSADRRTIAHLPQLITILAGDGKAQRWRAARWLAAPSPDLPGQVSAAQWLRAGGNPEPVLTAAHANSHRWAA